MLSSKVANEERPRGVPSSQRKTGENKKKRKMGFGGGGAGPFRFPKRGGSKINSRRKEMSWVSVNVQRGPRFPRGGAA